MEKRKSKKRSGRNSDWRHEELTVFLDRNLGRYIIANRLQSAGIAVEVHDKHLVPDAPDDEWISLVGRKGWTAITKDKNICYRAAELGSIRKHKARIIVIRSRNATGTDIAELLVNGFRRIARFSSRTPAPFVAGLYASGQLREYPIL